MRLTELSHGGGCGCKIAPALLSEMLAKMPAAAGFKHLMVGTETSDDAAVYWLNAEQALIATTDFFMPIVDDPFDFGRIAATNAISDIYAMGGKPIMALAIVGMPVNLMPVEVIQQILAGGASVCGAAGIPVAGGHSIDSPEPIYGLVVLGLVHPDRVRRNNSARAGDCLILGKPLGIGVLGTALKKGLLDATGYQELIATTTQLNSVGCALSEIDEVHALTDVTGFGLLGHLLEVCRGSGLAARIGAARVPYLHAAVGFAQQGIGPGAIARNLASFEADVMFSNDVPAWQQHLMTDPQTSGGLLCAVAPEAADRVLALFHQQGFAAAGIIGSMEVGTPRIVVDS